MTYRIVRHGNGEYAVLDDVVGVLVLEHESMGVCDAYMYAHLHPTSELAEVRGAYEAAQTGKGKP